MGGKLVYKILEHVKKHSKLYCILCLQAIWCKQFSITKLSQGDARGTARRNCIYVRNIQYLKEGQHVKNLINFNLKKCEKSQILFYIFCALTLYVPFFQS